MTQMTQDGLDRRAFLAASGSLALAFALSPEASAAADKVRKLPGSLAQNPRLDAWLRIDNEGRVTLFTGKVELGQGVLTALSQIAPTNSTSTSNKSRSSRATPTSRRTKA